MEENAMFRIPTSSSLSNAVSTSTVATITPVELNSAPLRVATENKKQVAPSPVGIYDELSAISEEVIACRRTVLERI